MRGSWKTRPFEEVFHVPLRNGLTRPKRVRGSGTRMVNMGELFAYRRIRNVKMDKVPLSEKEAGSYLLNSGDLLFARQSLVLEGAGKCSVVMEDAGECTFESHIIRARLEKSIADPLFYFYYFESHQGRSIIESIVEQVAAAGIRGSDLARLPVPVPPLPEQRTIAHILGTLDDKIELNRKMNQTLEEMARTIFKSWFVDFDPVRAKAAGKKPAGMDEATAALFPDGFEDSELGEIPRGWRVRSADSAAEISIGKTPPRKESQWFSTSVKDIRWISIKDMGASGTYISQTSEFLTEEAVEKFRVKRIPDNTVILSFKLTVGRVAITDGEMLSNEAIAHFVLDSESELSPEYLYCCLKNYNYEILGSTSSIARAINSKIVKSMPIMLPGRAIVTQFSKTAQPLFLMMKRTQNENESLSCIRDTLLPGLLSGKIRIKDAEKYLEAKP